MLWVTASGCVAYLMCRYYGQTVACCCSYSVWGIAEFLHHVPTILLCSSY